VRGDCGVFVSVSSLGSNAFLVADDHDEIRRNPQSPLSSGTAPEEQLLRFACFPTTISPEGGKRVP
jgi:hypothetical protein